MYETGFVITPPLLPTRPLLGIAYIIEFLKEKNIPAYLFDLNLLLYNKLPANQKKLFIKDSFHLTPQWFYAILTRYPSLFITMKEWIRKYNLKFLGIPFYHTNYYFSLELIKFIKKYFPQIVVISGGPEIFYRQQYLNSLSDLIDYFVIGEGEEAIYNIITGKEKKNIIYGDNKIEFHKLPFPKFDEFPLKLYLRKNSLPIIFSKGCIRKCKFCTERKLFKKVEFKTPEQIYDEIMFYYRKYNTTWFVFYDSCLNQNIEKFEKLLKRLVNLPEGIVWEGQIVIRNDMDKSIFNLIKKSHCINLFIGLESGDDEVLKFMRKGFTVKVAENFIKNLQKNNINFELSIIVNYPGEQIKNLMNTLNFLKKNNLKRVAQINPYIPSIYDEVEIVQGFNFYEGIRRMKSSLEFLKENEIKILRPYIGNLVDGFKYLDICS